MLEGMPFVRPGWPLPRAESHNRATGHNLYFEAVTALKG
jgi:hypothetical protein